MTIIEASTSQPGSAHAQVAHERPGMLMSRLHSEGWIDAFPVTISDSLSHEGLKRLRQSNECASCMDHLKASWFAVWLAARAEMASVADLAAGWSAPASTMSSKGPRAPAAQAASWCCSEPCVPACRLATCAHNMLQIMYADRAARDRLIGRVLTPNMKGLSYMNTPSQHQQALQLKNRKE